MSSNTVGYISLRRVELKSKDCKRNCNCPSNTSKEKNRIWTTNSNNLLDIGGVAETCSGSFASLTGNVPEMEPNGQKRPAESEFRCGALKSYRGRRRMRGR